MTLLDYGYRIEVAQAVSLGGPPGTRFKATVFKHGWGSNGAALKGKVVGVPLIEGPVVDGDENAMIPDLLNNLSRLWRGAGGMENVIPPMEFEDGKLDTPLEAFCKLIVSDAAIEPSTRQKLCSLLPGGHRWERWVKSQESDFCVRCELVVGK